MTGMTGPGNRLKPIQFLKIGSSGQTMAPVATVAPRPRPTVAGAGGGHGYLADIA